MERISDSPAASASPEEVARFEATADQWWSADGVFKPLHRFNAVRVAYLRERAAARFGRRGEDANPLRGLRVLDIGCGGGLVAEPIARLGARVTGIDAGAANIDAALRHAKAAGLAIDYRQAGPEDLIAAGEQPYDLVMAMEVIEHVPDPAAFLAICARLVRPGGAFAMASLNRTARAWLLGKLGAEYVLRWLPAGTHDWGKFVKPSEAAATLRAQGLVVSSVDGVRFEPLRGRWSLSREPAVNYLLFAIRP
jgi:2-polyprenyl-6-hydroxyphenyl methylase/3-demethylubiquinone-9 3-methyltransferase